MNKIADNPIIVPDRELEDYKKRESEPPRIRCPLCGWSPATKTNGFARADTSGTRLIRVAYAQPRPRECHCAGGRVCENWETAASILSPQGDRTARPRGSETRDCIHSV